MEVEVMTAGRQRAASHVRALYARAAAQTRGRRSVTRNSGREQNRSPARIVADGQRPATARNGRAQAREGGPLPCATT
jgi:hypothetical protein